MKMSQSKQFSKLSKSSKSSDYGTPQDLFNKLNHIFSFKLDAATTPDNPLGTAIFYTKEDNGLEKPWNTNTYVNPPFGRGVSDWINKMSYESKNNPYVYVMLLPARTDTIWFQDLICRSKQKGLIYFLKGRLKFVNPQLNSKSEPHIIGSMLWIRNSKFEQIEELIANISGIMMD